MNETLQRFWDEVRVQCPGTEILLSPEEKLIYSHGCYPREYKWMLQGKYPYQTSGVLRPENEEEIKNRITEDYGIAPAEVESTRRYFNKKRAGYFRANTGNDWNNLKNYDIVLDSSKLGIEGCVNVLKGIFE